MFSYNYKLHVNVVKFEVTTHTGRGDSNSSGSTSRSGSDGSYSIISSNSITIATRSYFNPANFTLNDLTSMLKIDNCGKCRHNMEEISCRAI